MRNRILLASLTLMLFTVAGCSNWERQTFQALSASKAVIDQAQADYETGKLPHSQLTYDAVNKAKAAQTSAVEGMITFEQLKATNATAGALAKAQGDVAVILADLPGLITAIKSLYGGK